MKTMTATEASRSFAGLLDAVERGESFVIVRGGVRVATLGPASSGNGAALKTLLAESPDAEFASDVEAARAAVVTDAYTWPAD